MGPVRLTVCGLGVTVIVDRLSVKYIVEGLMVVVTSDALKVRV